MISNVRLRSEFPSRSGRHNFSALFIVLCLQIEFALQIFLVGELNQTLICSHYQKQNLSDPAFHTLRSISRSLRKFCQKKFFESKPFLCAPFLPGMWPFSCLIANRFWRLFSLSGNKCFICNNLFNLHITLSFGISGPILQLRKQVLRDYTPSKWPSLDSNPDLYDSKYWVLYYYNVWAIIQDSMFACLSSYCRIHKREFSWCSQNETQNEAGYRRK